MITGSETPQNASEFDERTLVYLNELSRLYPSTTAALSRLSLYQAELTLPKGHIHIISDIHGDHLKLRHVINNASGSIRPLVDSLFADSLTEQERINLLSLIYYPAESSQRALAKLPSRSAQSDFVTTSVAQQLVIIRALARTYPLEHVERVFPSDLSYIFQELLVAPQLERSHEFIRALVQPFLSYGLETELLRSMSRIIRNLSISELIIAGDFGDRGPRIDRVIDYVMRQPRVAITWGNHDVSWMGACLGSLVCIATVIRMSLRYQQLAQLEEGFGIPLTPLEDLVQEIYSDDDAQCFKSKGVGTRDATLLARMQKAISIIQFKLEGQVSDRNPQFHYSERNFLHRVDFSTGSISIGSNSYQLRDIKFPTVDQSSPYTLSAAELRCMELLRDSFLFSPRLWLQMKYLAEYGTMHLLRDHHLIFHGCIPCDQQGNFLSFPIDGQEFSGKALFEQLHLAVQRAFRERRESDLDLLWYLWGGARSPLFGKDKMTTFETYLIGDKETHKEVKNPYFSLIHEVAFCDKILKEFGADPSLGLIVNGHVPVKIEAGESPIKRSGKAVTIDGAFSEAYGDRGYTLVLGAERTTLAQHHHFDSVRDALESGTDIIPSIGIVREFLAPRSVSDTERGEQIRHHIDMLRLLIQAYQENRLRERL